MRFLRAYPKASSHGTRTSRRSPSTMPYVYVHVHICMHVRMYARVCVRLCVCIIYVKNDTPRSKLSKTRLSLAIPVYFVLP